MELRLRQFVGRCARIAALILAMCALLLCAAALMPTQKAYAVTDGWNEWGTCEWQIDGQNCLTIRPVDNGAKGETGQERPWESSVRMIEKVVIEKPIVGNISGFFQGCASLKGVVGLANLEFGNDFYASSLFQGCSSLESVDLRGLNLEGQSSLFRAFDGCTSLKSIDFGDVNLVSVQLMVGTFSGCTSLEEVIFPEENALRPTNCSEMFQECTSLSTIDLSRIDFSNTSNIASMFGQCTNLKSIDMSSWDLSRLEDAYGAFDWCTSLEEVNMSGLNLYLEDAQGMFSGCTKLKMVDLSETKIHLPLVTRYMFSGCASLESLDLSAFGSNHLLDAEGMFRGCEQLKNITLPNGFIGRNCSSVNYMFLSCDSLTVIPSNFTFGDMSDSLEKVSVFSFNNYGNWPIGNLETYYYGTDPNVINYDWAGDNRKLVTSQTSELAGTVAIVGDPCEGVTLKATATLDASCNDAQLRYQWFDASNDQQVSEVTDSVIFTIPEDFLGKSFYCVVTDASGKYTSSLKSNTVTANHSFGEWEVTKEATCTEDGSQTRTCEKCNYQETQAISAKGHTYSTNWTSDASGHWHACDVCGTKGDYAGHELTEWTTTKEPACAEPGEEKRSCSTCGYEETKEIAALNHEVGDEWNSDATHHWKDCIHCGESVIGDDHNYGEWILTKQPTCTEDGEQKHSCQTCGWEETETIPATSHTPSDEWSHNATDHWHVCQNCQAEVDKAAHTFGQWITVIEPGEFTPGEKVRTCEVCGFEERAEIPGTGHVSDEQWHFDGTNHWNLCTDCGNQVNVEAHDFGEWTVDVPAGCTTEGTEIRTCDTCGYEQTQAIPATGHTYGEWTVTTEPTCTEEGVESRTCENCGNTETRAVDELGHNFSADWSSDAAGHRHECTRCDAVADEAAHTFGDWQVKQAAGCTDGIEARYCTACNYEETRTIPGAGHQPASEWSSDASGHWHACANCDDRLDLAEHTFGDWTVTADPTEETVGSKERTCEVCGYKDVVEIPALTPGDPGTGEGGDAGESSEQGSSEQENGEEAAAEEADATPQTSDPLGVVASFMAGIVLISAATALVTRKKMLRR